MNGHETNWLPGVVVLVAGALAALIFALNSRRKAKPAPPPSSSQDLESRYQSLLTELKEHAANKHLQTAADWEVEQARLEQAAANTLREKAGVKHEELKAEARAEKKSATSAPAETGFWAQNPSLKGALIGAGVVLFFVILVQGLSTQSKERAEGQGMTGVVPPGAPGSPGGPQQAQVDPKLRALMQRAQAQPDDVEVLADAAAELVKRQMFDDAFPLVQRGTILDPFNVRIRICRAVLDAVDGRSMPALLELEHLGATYDDAYDAHLYAGMLAMDLHDLKKARSELQAYVDSAPQSTQPPMIRAAIQQIDQELSTGGTP